MDEKEKRTDKEIWHPDTPNGRLPVNSLSGGNMQKVIVAREFSSDPYVLIASQPTRGIDVGATEFVREQLVRAADIWCCAFYLVSADLGEVMSLVRSHCHII